MSTVFENNEIAGISLRNHFVRSATYEGMATDEGAVTQHLINCMVDLVEGEVGLIISGHAFVCAAGQAGPKQMAIYSDDFNYGLASMTEAVHGAGGKIVAQLAHSGAAARAEVTKLAVKGPSEIALEDGSVKCEAMSLDDIAGTIKAFGEAGKRAKTCGFDGVQIHAAHGYLLSQFLSGHFNKRDDEYGGSLENRARMVVEVLQAIKSEAGQDFPVLIKMNSEDFIDGGLSVDEMLAVVKMLQDAGIDGVELSGGMLENPPETSPVRTGKTRIGKDELYYREAAKRFKGEMDVPLILVGGIRKIETAEAIVAEGVCDYVSLSRPLIRQPKLISQWKSGDRNDATCISCNLCFGPALKGEGIYCVIEKKAKKK